MPYKHLKSRKLQLTLSCQTCNSRWTFRTVFARCREEHQLSLLLWAFAQNPTTNLWRPQFPRGRISPGKQKRIRIPYRSKSSVATAAITISTIWCSNDLSRNLLYLQLPFRVQNMWVRSNRNHATVTSNLYHQALKNYEDLILLMTFVPCQTKYFTSLYSCVLIQYSCVLISNIQYNDPNPQKIEAAINLTEHNNNSVIFDLDTFKKNYLNSFLLMKNNAMKVLNCGKKRYH